MIDGVLIIRLLIWGLIGMALTPLVYRQRGRDPRRGLLPGALIGAVGSLYLLIPFWLLVGRPRKVCPTCEQSIRANAATCPYCDHVFSAPEPKAEVVRLGYPEYLPTVILWVIIGAALVPLIYSREGADPAAGLVAGAILGAIIGLVGLELMWLLAPREGKRCPECRAAVPARRAACPRCAHRFTDAAVDAGARAELAEPPLPMFEVQPRGLPRFVWRPLDLKWGWLALGALLVGLLLSPVGLGVTKLPGTDTANYEPVATLGVPPTPAPSVRLARGTVEARFKLSGFTFEPYVDDTGMAGVRGTQQAQQTWLYIMGPEDAVETVAVAFFRPAIMPDEQRERQDDHVERMLQLVIADDADAAEARIWVAAQQARIWEAKESDTTVGTWQVYMWADPDDRWMGVGVRPQE